MVRALFVSKDARVAKQLESKFDLIVSDRPVLEQEFDIEFYNLQHEEDNIIELLEKKDVDEAICVGYRKLFSADFLDRFDGRILNLHPSLLPAFKGLDIYSRVVEREVKVSGVTLHHISEEMDEGKIIDQVSYRVPEDVSVEELKRYATKFEVMILEKYF